MSRSRQRGQRWKGWTLGLAVTALAGIVLLIGGGLWVTSGFRRAVGSGHRLGRLFRERTAYAPAPAGSICGALMAAVVSTVKPLVNRLLLPQLLPSTTSSPSTPSPGILEQGTHRELLSRDGAFARLCALRFPEPVQ